MIPLPAVNQVVSDAAPASLLTPGFGAICTDAPERPVIRYHGGKFTLAPWVISHFPPHNTYTEGFGGGGSVLMRKARCQTEVFNDMESEVVNLFRVLRDPITAENLRMAVTLTPFSREEFRGAYQLTADPVERARRAVVRATMGFGSAGCLIAHRTGFRSNSNRSNSTPAHDWTTWPNQVPAFVERLRGVVIEHRPAWEIMRQHDSPMTLHYVDPPYVQSTRTFKKRRSGQVYQFDMSDRDHRALAKALHSLEGMVVLSGYGCDLYDKELYPGWMRVEHASHALGTWDRTEVLWLNPLCASRQQSPELPFRRSEDLEGVATARAA